MATSPFGPWFVPTFLAWFVGSWIFHVLGITLGYHRLLTHRSLQVPRWLMYVITAAGYLSLMGSPIVWVGVHRLHHQRSDQAGDPHSPADGFFHAMFGWMFKMRSVQSDEALQRAAYDLMSDPVFPLLGTEHKAFQAVLCLGVNILFRVALLAVFGWAAFLGSVAAMLGVFVSTQLVNSVCHLKAAGYRNFPTSDGSRNVWWVALLTLGEGWHNNHHAIPRSARHGLRWWEIDLTYWAVWVLEKLGLASSVVRPNERKVSLLANTNTGPNLNANANPNANPKHKRRSGGPTLTLVEPTIPAVVPAAVSAAQQLPQLHN